MSDIVEFLRARLDEDEATLRQPSGPHSDYHSSDPYGAFSPSCPACLAGWPGRGRALAEVEAKRQIVEMCEPLAQWEVRRQTRNLAQGTLRELARPYRDHPGYDPAWGV